MRRRYDGFVTISSHARNVLELPKVLDRLAEFADFSISRDAALNLDPLTDRASILAALDETAQARSALEFAPNLTVGSARDITSELDAAEKMARLDPLALVGVADTIRSGNRLRSTLQSIREAAPELASRADRIEPLNSVLGAISESIAADRSILDSASAKLAALRSEARTVHNRLLRRLQTMVASPHYSRILQDPIFTQRSGRYVLPIRQESRSRFEGVVHDVSSSGATVFMEPLELVGLNNDWRRLRLEEKNEEERILQSLSSQVGAVAVEARENLRIIAGLDLAFAKARYAGAIGAMEPEITADFSFRLLGARHPLLGDAAVAIDIRIESDEAGFRALIITGPNTGGKTVALKCVGLLHLMAACGLHVPVGDGTNLAAYSSIYADIGDEQSIEQSLSTFSSHLTNLVEMVQVADSGTLVLADEIGAGTDPIEGAALAQAIVERLLKSGCALIATTHFGSLANFAFSNPLVENASVRFDPATLSPTFELSVGLPGRSNAAEIALRLGLESGIVARAQELAGSEHREAVGLIDDIRRRSDEAAELRLKAEEAANRAEESRRRAEFREREAEQRTSEDRRRTRRESRRLLREMEALVRKAREQPGNAEAARLADLASRSREQERRLSEVEADSGGLDDVIEDPAEFRPGDRVAIGGIRGIGEVISVDTSGREAEVAIGPARMRVAAQDLRPAAAETRVRASLRSEVPHPPGVSAPIEGEIRGIRVEEVPYEVDRLIDRALSEGSSELRIIHGRGTGALRSAVRQYAAEHPLIRSYSDAGPRDGGSGVTVVLLGE